MRLRDPQQANQAVLEVRRLRRQIDRAEQRAEDAAERARERMVDKTEGARKRVLQLTGQLRGYYRQHREPGQKSIKLQDGIIGERVVPRIDMPKNAVDRVPPEALSIKKKVNKTALKALGEKAMADAGARIVRPSRFYVATADEDAEK